MLHVLFFLLGLAQLGHAVTGKATYYGGNLEGGNCMFSNYKLPSNIYGSAISGKNWNTAGICGTCLQVTGSLGTITVMVREQKISPGKVKQARTSLTWIGGGPMSRMRYQSMRPLRERLRRNRRSDSGHCPNYLVPSGLWHHLSACGAQQSRNFQVVVSILVTF
jgi:hypothetical protein